MGFARPDIKWVTDARTQHRPQTARYPGKVTAAGARSEQRGTGPPGEEAAAIAVVIGVAAIKLLAGGVQEIRTGSLRQCF